MKKGRSIVREIRRSETFGALTFRQRDLFQGLIETADDQGRQVGTATAVRSEIWPYDDISSAEVQAELEVLASGTDPFIKLYKVFGKTYIQIINWWIYQPMQWAQASNYPAPDGWIDRYRYQGTGGKIIQLNWDKTGGFKSETLPEPLPSSLPSELPSQPDSQLDSGLNKDKDKDKEKLREGKENLKPEAQKNPVTSPASPGITALQAWNYATGALQSEGMSRADYDAYVRNLILENFDGKTVRVKAINRFTVDFLNKRMIKSKLENYLRTFLNDTNVTLELCVIGPPEAIPIGKPEAIITG